MDNPYVFKRLFMRDNRLKFFIVFISVIFCFAHTSFGQYYDSGQDPFSINWKQIKTPYFQIVFPAEIEPVAQTYASYLSKIHKTGGKTLSHIPPKVPIIIHNQTIISNGEVAWSPKRMNLYTVAPQDNYFQPWAQHLTLHEFRHTVHISKIDQGFTHGLTYVFGEQAIAAILGLHVPFWFMEGDAVAYETGASNAGRGRIPDFQMKLKAQLCQDGVYSYPKAMFGSYKDFVPNHYELGYYLIANARRKYDVKIWEHVLTKVGRNPIHPNPFSAGIKEVTGLPERKFYKESINYLKIDTEKEHVENKSYSNYTYKNNDYESYYSPKEYSGGLIAFKTSYKKLARFIKIDSTGNEHKIYLPGHVFDNTFSLAESKIVWNEYRGTRWSNRNYSRIAIYDLATKKKRYIENKGRIFFSRISPDGTKIVSTEVSEKVKWSITIRDFRTGLLKQTIGFDTLQPVQPEWSPNSDAIVFVTVGSKGKSLGIVQLGRDSIDWILKNEKLEFSLPKYYSTGVLVKGVYNNVSNYFSYSFITKQWNAITNVKYGVGEGNVIGKNFVFSSYTADGYKIDKVHFAEPISYENTKPQKYYSLLANNLSDEETYVNFDSLETNYNVQNYSRFKHLFNLHSWAPLAININNQELGLGVTLMSQNTLSTSFLTAGYKYHRAEQRNEFFIDYTYKGFYPILSLKYQYTSPYYNSGIDAMGTFRLVEYDIHSLSVNASFPFVFNYGPWRAKIQPELSYSYDAAIFTPNEYFILENGLRHCFTYGFYGYNLISKSHRDLYSKWGQILNVQYKHAPFDSAGYIFSASGSLLFPGLLANHSFRVGGGVQAKEKGTFEFSDFLYHPRGYIMIPSEEMANTSINYSFPVLYPDLNAWEYVYLKRIKANLFYDAAQYSYEGIISYQESYGIDLVADFHAFRFVAPIQMGVRYVRKRTVSENYFGLLFSIDFNALY